MRLAFLPVLLVLAACNETTPVVVSAPPPRPVLPVVPFDFARPVPLCKLRVGQDVRVFAACERAAHILANRGLEDDGAFYRDVVARFGAADPSTRSGASDAR